VLAVPFLDTTFVVLKRMKYGRPIYRADANHFHHRFDRIGFSRRKSLAYLYAWTILLAAFAVALRFIPYSDEGGSLDTGWTAVVVLSGVIVVAASIYLVYVLELLKLRRVEGVRIRRARPDVSEEEIDAAVAKSVETGEFDAQSRT
jgi:UDP-GlcNAc:undecaprenyl-phosphate GlcNAc-1-phosphate transferase